MCCVSPFGWGRATVSNVELPTCCFTALIIFRESLPERIFSIIPHLGVDCTRPVEQTSSLTLWLFLPNWSLIFIFLSVWPQLPDSKTEIDVPQHKKKKNTHCLQIIIHSLMYLRRTPLKHPLTFVNTCRLTYTLNHATSRLFFPWKWIDCECDWSA